MSMRNYIRPSDYDAVRRQPLVVSRTRAISIAIVVLVALSGLLYFGTARAATNIALVADPAAQPTQCNPMPCRVPADGVKVADAVNAVVKFDYPKATDLVRYCPRVSTQCAYEELVWKTFAPLKDTDLCDACLKPDIVPGTPLGATCADYEQIPKSVLAKEPPPDPTRVTIQYSLQEPTHTEGDSVTPPVPLTGANAITSFRVYYGVSGSTLTELRTIQASQPNECTVTKPFTRCYLLGPLGVGLYDFRASAWNAFGEGILADVLTFEVKATNNAANRPGKVIATGITSVEVAPIN